MTKVAIYARVSTSNRQDSTRQIEELTEQIIRDGYSTEDIDVFTESISGYKFDKERPEMDRLNQKIIEDKSYYARIYVSEISRIGRKPKKIREIIELWNDAGVDLYIRNIGQNTLNSDGSRNSIVNMIIQVLIEFAHSEAELFKQRSQSGLLSSAKAGKAGGGKYLPYGYRRDKNKLLTISDDEAEVVELVYDLYRKGYGSRVISGILNNKKYETRTNISLKGKELNFKIKKKAEDVVWSDKQVLDMLSNTIYKGQRRYKGRILNAPAIISEDLFDECTEIRKNKSHRNHTTKYTYLLKDRLICGCCGRNYFAKFKPHLGGDKVYICSSRLKKNGNCGNTGVNISLIESTIYNEIISSDSILQYINQKDKVKKKLESDLAQLQSLVATNERLLSECIQQQDTLLTYAIKAIMDADLYSKKNSELDKERRRLTEKLNKDRTQLRKIKSSLKKQEEIGTTMEILKDAKNNRVELRAIFLDLIDKVIINVIDKDTVLANVFLAFEQVVLTTSLRLFLDTKGIRKPKKTYRYLPMLGRDEAVRYKENKLQTPVQELQEELYIINENAGVLDLEFVTISEQNVLTIPIN